MERLLWTIINIAIVILLFCECHGKLGSESTGTKCDCEQSSVSPEPSKSSQGNESLTNSNDSDSQENSYMKPTNRCNCEKKNNPAVMCPDLRDRSINRTWRAHNTREIILKKVKVYFKENGSDWYANVTWLPPQDKRLYGYVVVQFKPSSGVVCKEILNNNTYTLLDMESEAEILRLAVFSLPGYLDVQERANFKFKDYHRNGIPDLPPVTFRDTPPIDDWTSYLAGVLAGILLIFILGFVLYRRKTRGSQCREGNSIIDSNDNNSATGLMQINSAATKPQNNDVYFASYLPENEKFSNEVATIAYKLGTMGYKVVFDQVDSVRMNEIGFNMWVDRQILEAKKYIVFCSPAYVRLWQSLATSSTDNKLSHVNKEDLVRVRYEIKRISDVYSENCSTSRIVCIKMDPKMTTKQLPPWMNHNMLLWPEQKEDVIRRLNDQAAMVMHV